MAVTFFEKLNSALWAQRSPLFSYALAGCIAILFIAHLFPISFLSGKGAFFEQVDASQHVAGWLFYVRDSWHFPLLHTSRLNHPSGVSIAFTDSIPLAALLMKTIGKWLPEHFHYLGLWHAVAFLSNALGAVFLLRALGVRHLIGEVTAVFFALTWPALLWRLGHTALLTHGWIFLALGFYFRGRNDMQRSSRYALALIAVSLASLLTHPYLFAMCYGVFLAYLGDQALHQPGWSKQLLRLGWSIAAIATVAILFGYAGNSVTASGYGQYSMNVNAPFCGSRFFSCAESVDAHQFAAFHFSDATGGQYEGYNYWGLGLLLLLPFAVAATWRKWRLALPHYAALLLLATTCFLYAISHKIYFGSHELLSYTVPPLFERITGTFRASGRFFWLVGYLVLFGTLAALLRQPSRRTLLLLAVALPLQWADVQPLMERIRAKAAAPESGDIAPWEQALAATDLLHIYPAFGCDDGDSSVYWFFQSVAARYRKLLDTGYIARANVDCENNARGFDAQFRPRHLYIMPAAYLKNPFAVPRGFHTAAQRGACVKWREAILCQPGVTQVDWKNAGLAVELVPPFQKNKITWAADELLTLAGKLDRGRLLPVASNQSGFLSYGPYLTLSPGRYRYTLRYVSKMRPEQQAGRWDVVTGSGRTGAAGLASGVFVGTSDAVNQVEGTFEAAHWNRRFEIRTFFTAPGDLQLMDVSLEKLLPHH